MIFQRGSSISIQALVVVPGYLRVETQHTASTRRGRMEPPRSIWDECQEAVSLYRHWQKEIAADAVREISAMNMWSKHMTKQRVRIGLALTPEVIDRSELGEHELHALPLARLLDAARKRTARERSICLAYAARGRRPRWADELDAA